MGADKPQEQNDTGSYKAFSAGQVTQRRQSNQANQGTQFSARDGELTACVHSDLIDPGTLSISLAYRNDFIMDVEINIGRWERERSIFLMYGTQGDSRWVTLGGPEDFGKLIAAINEVLGRLGIKDKVGVNIANLIRSVLEDPKRYYALAPGSAYEACDIGAESPREIQPSKHETFLGLNGANVTEGSFMAQVRVPNEDTIDITIRRRDAEDSPVVHIRLDIVRGKGTRFRTRAAVYLVDKDGTTEVESLNRLDAEKLLRRVRALLHTNRQGLPSNGRIAGLLEEAITQAVSEAKRRSREYRAKIGEELYQQALNEPGLKEDTLKYVIDTVQLLHAGDDKVIIVVFLIILTSRLPEPYRLNVLILAPSGKGKTDVLKLISRLIPRKWKYAEMMLGATPKSFIYEGLERKGFVVDLKGKVIIINEPSWLTQNSDVEESGFRVIKQLFYDLSDTQAIPYRTTVKDEQGRIRSVELKVIGRPVLIATAEDKDIPSIPVNMFTRFFPVWLDTSLRSLALSGMKIREKLSNSALFREFDRRARLVRAFLAREYPRIDDVVITEDAGRAIIDCPNPDNPMLCRGYVGELLNAETRAVFNRAASYLFALSAAYAYLRRKWREEDGRRVLVVTKQDVDEVWELVGDVIKALARGKESKTEALMKKIHEIFMEHGPHGILSPGDVHKELAGMGEVFDPAYVRRLLSMMTETGLLERCRWGKYALKCPEADVTKYLNEEGEEKGNGGE
jgi:AcrR family transcriptional regulator